MADSLGSLDARDVCRVRYTATELGLPPDDGFGRSPKNSDHRQRTPLIAMKKWKMQCYSLTFALLSTAVDALYLFSKESLEANSTATLKLEPQPTRLEADRYYTIIDMNDQYWLFSRRWLHSGRPSTMVMYRSWDGLHFEQVGSNVIKGDSATNGAVFRSPNATHSVLILGGRSGDPNLPSHKGLGVVGIRAFELSRHESRHNRIVELFDGKPILQGNTGGCHEGRAKFKNHCEFDGRLSMVFWKGRYWLYARANLDMGIRYVQVARSKDLLSWSNWRLVAFHDYTTERGRLVDGEETNEFTDVNIYFLAVHQNPVDPKASLVGLMPVHDPRQKDPELRAAICLTFSTDGVKWSSLIPLLESTPLEQRTFDHPAVGLFADQDRVHFFMHRDVPHISTSPKDSRIERFSLSRASFQSLYDAATLELHERGAHSP